MATDDKSRYYQDIAAFFLRLRGAPFILSGREIHLLAGWEKQGIPLSAVRQGIEVAFERLSKKAEPGRRPVTLLACDPDVQRAFGQVQERRVGVSRSSGGREAKRAAIALAVKNFLADVPAEWPVLRRAYEQALRLIESGADSEEGLERLEANIEEALAAHCPPEEWDRARRQLGPAGPGGEGKALLRRTALKNIREKYRIPYVSYPYY